MILMFFMIYKKSNKKIDIDPLYITLDMAISTHHHFYGPPTK